MHLFSLISTRFLTFNKAKRQYAKKLHKIIGFYPLKLSSYEQALRHHSISKKIHHSGSKDSNERLEFLGDAIINAVVADYIFRKYPFKDEGFLTQLRSKIVSRESLNELAIKIGLNLLVEYDKKALHNINLRNSIFGNALEALIGAIFLDRGYIKSQYFIIDKLLRFHIDIDKLKETEFNFKGRLIEYCNKQGFKLDFKFEEIPDGKSKIYRVDIVINQRLMGQAEHNSKKKSEQMAAQKALDMIQSVKDELEIEEIADSIEDIQE